ncbi:MAG: hypothetical protein R3F59_06530 [Myxococcota bacterium]
MTDVQLLEDATTAEACALLGRFATIHAEATVYDGLARTQLEATIRTVLVPGTPAFEQACRAL